MARMNVKKTVEALTHEGAVAYPHTNAEQRLRRSFLSCMLWEDEFYEDGQSIAKRIAEAVTQVSPERVMTLAIEARTKYNLRHAPLWVLTALVQAKGGYEGLANTIAAVVQRPDEMGELLTMLWGKADRKAAKQHLPHPVRKGLRKAFCNFDEYQLAKYDRKDGIRLKDVMKLVRPTPRDEAQAALFGRVKSNTLATPDTWESALVGGADKRETFERLLKEGKLGYLALLRNLRNMEQSGVDEQLVKDAILARKGAHRVLPFRYVAAARIVPKFERELDAALCAAIDAMPVLPGKTIVLIDVSGSMDAKLSGKSDLSRVDAAAALASMLPGDVEMYSFSYKTVRVPPRRGMAGVDAILRSQSHGGTDLGGAVQKANCLKHDRLIVISDEQSHTRVPDPVVSKAYMINVASYRNGIGYGKWTHIDGFSEAVLKYINELEAQ